jgi:cytochrome P450
MSAARRGADLQMQRLHQLLTTLDDVEGGLGPEEFPSRTQIRSLKKQTDAVGNTSSNPKWKVVRGELDKKLTPEDVSQLLKTARRLAVAEQKQL